MEKAKAAQPPAVTSEGAMILPEADDVLEPYKKELEEQEANIAKDLDALKEQSQSAVDTIASGRIKSPLYLPLLVKNVPWILVMSLS